MKINDTKDTLIYQARATCLKDHKTYVYIGQTTQLLEKRRLQHENSASKNDPGSFHQALRRIPFDDWEWGVVFTCDSSVATEEETRIILQWRGQEKNNSNIVVLNGTEKQVPCKNIISKQNYGIPRANKQNNYTPGEMGEKFLRASGKIKPVVNLKTGKEYRSILEAEAKDGVCRVSIKISCDTGKMLMDGTRYAYLDLNDKAILVEGHTLDCYIGRRARKIKELISGKIFNSAFDAAQYYKVSDSVVGGGAIGKYAVVLGQYVFCYLNEDGSERRLAKHDYAVEQVKKIGLLKYAAWPVKFTYEAALAKNEVAYFSTLNEMCDRLKIRNRGHVKSVCDGARYHVEKYRVAYYNHETKKPMLTEKHGAKSKRIICKIQCLNDGEIYNNCTEAGSKYAVGANQIGMCARGILKSVRVMNTATGKKDRFRFAYLDANNRPIKEKKHEEPLSQREGIQRIMLTSAAKIQQLGKNTFNSVSEFCRETGVPPKRARKYLESLKNSTQVEIDMLGYDFIVIG